MTYEAKNFESLIGIEGLSEQLLRNHFALYQGYVANANKLMEKLDNLLREGKANEPEYAELKRRFGWEFNGMRLHELYFSNIVKGGKAADGNSKLHKKIEKDFGSFENWEKDFRAAGMIRGIGWVILYYDIPSGRFFNVWVNEHDAGHLSAAAPILVADVFEHSYMLDYGLKKADYIETFFKAIDWSAVSERFDMMPM